MCFHWQAKAAQVLLEELKSMSKEEIINRLKEENENLEKFEIDNADLIKEHGRGNGFFGGTIFSYKLNIRTIEEYLMGMDPFVSSIDAEKTLFVMRD